MTQAKSLIANLKKELRKQGKTYRDVAGVLKLSEASVKRLFAKGTFTLDRLDSICELLGLDFADLVRLMEQTREMTTSLSVHQEQELVSDIKLLLMAHFLMSRWTFSEIIETYEISEVEGIQLVAQLDRMKIIQLLPGNRVKLLLSPDFAWISNGPIQKFYEQKVQSEFFDSSFTGPGEYRVFLSGMITHNSNTELIRRLKRVADEFIEMSIDDESFPIHERSGMSISIAMRPWGIKLFETLRRNKKK